MKTESEILKYHLTKDSLGVRLTQEDRIIHAMREYSAQTNQNAVSGSVCENYGKPIIEHNADGINVSRNISNPIFPSVYWLVIWLGCCIILVSVLYLNIQHQKKVDKIFEDYYKKVSVINVR